MWREKGSAYLQLQSTRPQMIGYALADSPVGQAAWIYDIFNAGTGMTGHPEQFLSRDDMLDEIMLYWLTNTAASSARFYLEQAELLGKRNNPGRVDLAGDEQCRNLLVGAAGHQMHGPPGRLSEIGLQFLEHQEV